MRLRVATAASAALLTGALVLAAPLTATAAEDPYIHVQTRTEILGSFFESNTPITIAIDRSQGGLEQPIDFTTDENGNFRFRLADVADIQPTFDIGDKVTVTQSSVTKEVVVGAVEVLEVDVTTDTVRGVAAPGSPVEVRVDVSGTFSYRRVIADGAGEWSVDYSIAGSSADEFVTDIVYDLHGEANGPIDADGDYTGWWWWAPSPGLWVSEHNLNGWSWAQPGEVRVTVDDPAAAGLEIDVALPLDGNGGFNFNLPEGFLQPGFTVTATDGDRTISFVTPVLTITSVDPSSNMITGTGDPGVTITVHASADDESSYGQVEVLVEAAGTWEADFTGVADLTYGWNGSAEREMVPNGRYADNWHIPPAVLSVNQVGGDVSGSGWPVEFDVTVTIDDPEVEGEIADYAFTVTPFDDDPKDPGGGFHRFIGDEFPIEPGHIITASNVVAGGDLTKVLIVEQLEIVAIQTSFDTVAGWAPPDSGVTVFIQNQDGGRRLTMSDGTGWWQVDFSVSSGSDDPEENKLVDLRLGTAIEAQLEADEDGDYVRHSRQIEPQPGGGLPPVEHTVGMVDPNRGRWRLLDEAGNEHSFWFGTPGDIPMMGDWDCDGDETPGLYRQSNGYVYLRNSNTTGPGEVRFTLGIKGDIPLAGDFNGDGCDTVAVYRRGHVFMTNVLGQDEGFFIAEYDYFFGVPGDKPFVGDFDGDGVETVGLHRESTGYVYFRQTHTTGVADSEFYFGIPNDRILAGDWNLSYGDTVAIFRPGDSTFYFRNSNTLGIADMILEWGKSFWLPVAGEFGL